MSISVEKIDSKLLKLKGVAPSVVIDDLRTKLRKTDIDENQLNDIVNRTSEVCKKGHVLDKLDNIAATLNELNALVGEREPVIAIPEGKSETVIPIPSVSAEDIKLKTVDSNISSYITLMKWIEFLVERAGMKNLHKILEWYVDIGWINDEVYTTMLTYAKGMEVEESVLHHQGEDSRIVGLAPNDHIRSLLFIEKIKGRRLERTLLTSLEDEIARVKDQFRDTDGV
jgi:flagellar protein FlaD